MRSAGVSVPELRAEPGSPPPVTSANKRRTEQLPLNILPVRMTQDAVKAGGFLHDTVLSLPHRSTSETVPGCLQGHHHHTELTPCGTAQRSARLELTPALNSTAWTGLNLGFGEPLPGDTAVIKDSGETFPLHVPISLSLTELR